MKSLLTYFKQQPFSLKKNHSFLQFDGKKGSLSLGIDNRGINSTLISKKPSIFFSQKKDLRLWKKLIINNLKAISSGYLIRLHLQGIGYRALVYQDTNQLFLKTEGQIFLTYTLPSAVFCKAKKQKIILFSLDKQALYNTVQNIKNLQWPNPYTGKGIRIYGEIVPLKVGKQRNR